MVTGFLSKAQSYMTPIFSDLKRGSAKFETSSPKPTQLGTRVTGTAHLQTYNLNPVRGLEISEWIMLVGKVSKAISREELYEIQKRSLMHRKHDRIATQLSKLASPGPSSGASPCGIYKQTHHPRKNEDDVIDQLIGWGDFETRQVTCFDTDRIHALLKADDKPHTNFATS